MLEFVDNDIYVKVFILYIDTKCTYAEHAYTRFPVVKHKIRLCNKNRSYFMEKCFDMFHWSLNGSRMVLHIT